MQTHKLPEMNLIALDWPIEKEMESTKNKLGPIFLKLNTSIPKKGVKKFFS